MHSPQPDRAWHLLLRLCRRSPSGGAGVSAFSQGSTLRTARRSCVRSGHQILHHRHVRQRVDLHRLDFTSAIGLSAGERVGAVDVHGTTAADALAAGAAEGQRGVDLVLDLDQRVQNHRPAGVEVHLVGVDARVARPRPDPSGRSGNCAPAWRRRAPSSLAGLGRLRGSRRRTLGSRSSVPSFAQYTRFLGGMTETSLVRVCIFTGR